MNIHVKNKWYNSSNIYRTDLYLYAVDPQMNVIIDMETLQKWVFSYSIGVVSGVVEHLHFMWKFFHRTKSIYQLQNVQVGWWPI